MHQVSLEDAEKSFLSLIQDVKKGEEVVITQKNKPIAKIISAFVEKSLNPKKIKAGSAKGLIEIMDDFDEPLEDFKDYM